MFYIVHALIGSFIGNTFSSIFIIIILGLFSHFIIDLIPHWDGLTDKDFFHKNGKGKIYKSKVVIEILDGLASLGIIFFMYFYFGNPLIIFGAVIALLPDIVRVFYFMGLKHKYFISYLDFHSKIQREINWKWGLLTQLIVVAIILLIFL